MNGSLEPSATGRTEVDFRLYCRVLWRFKLLVLARPAARVALARSRSSASAPTGSRTASRSLVEHDPPRRDAERLPLGAPLRARAHDRTDEPGRTQPASRSPTRTASTASPSCTRSSRRATRCAADAARRPDPRADHRDTAWSAARTATLLPLIDLTAISTSPRGARSTLATRSANALDDVHPRAAAREQRSRQRPRRRRAGRAARGATVYQPRSKTMPIVVFLAVMFATVGLAFLLENLRPASATETPTTHADFGRDAARRTA